MTFPERESTIRLNMGRVTEILHSRQGKRIVDLHNGLLNNLVNGVRRPTVASVDSDFNFDARRYSTEAGASMLKDGAIGVGLLTLASIVAPVAPPVAIVLGSMGMKKLGDALYDDVQSMRTLGNPFKEDERNGRTPKTIQRLEAAAEQVRNRFYVPLTLRRLS